MTRVLLDTVGQLALWNRRDPWHGAAKAARATLVAEGAEFYMSTHVLLESGNAASRTPLRRDVIDLRTRLIAEDRLIVPTPDDEAAAWAAYARGEAGDASIVDHVSFAVIRRLGLARAFTNDRHFRAAGFEPLF